MKYLILTITAILLISGCIKEECQIYGGTYEFEIPATLFPAKDTFNIGDTITFTSEFSDEVYERKTDRYYKLRDFKFFPQMGIKEISDSITDESVLQDFQVLVETLGFSQYIYNDGAIVYLGEYDYSENMYSLSYKFIPTKGGLYLFGYGLSIGQLGENQDFDGKCTNIDIDALVVLNNGADNNIEMLNDSQDPYYNDWTLQKPDQRFHKGGGYCFYVKE